MTGHQTGDSRKRAAEAMSDPTPRETPEAEVLHTMRWTYDGDGTKVEAVCHAADGADCRLTSVSCECEHWGEIQRRDDGTIWHNIVEGSETEPQWHEVRVADWCNICLFINESGCAEELTPDGEHHEFILADIPFEPVWENDGCSWRPLAARKADPARDADAYDDRNAAYIRGRRDMAAEQAKAKADPARDAELRAEGAREVRERVEAVLEEVPLLDESARRYLRNDHGNAKWHQVISEYRSRLRAALTEAGGES